MSRIRSHRYITKIYNSSDCTKYTSIQSKDLCNITKHNFYHNAISITLQSAKFTLITSALLSKREYIISSNNHINPFCLYWKEIMFIKLNKNTLYVNFNKRNLFVHI